MEKQTEGFFSLGTGTLPISPYECPVHFMELMKSCTDGIHLNKGSYSQGRFLCGISWAVSQLAQPYQPSASTEPGKFLRGYQMQRFCAPAAVSSMTYLLVQQFGPSGNLSLGVMAINTPFLT